MDAGTRQEEPFRLRPPHPRGSWANRARSTPMQCRRFFKSGFCKYGGSCFYIHATHEECASQIAPRVLSVDCVLVEEDLGALVGWSHPVQG